VVHLVSRVDMSLLDSGCYNELRAKVNKVIASSSEMKDHPVMMINMHRWMESMECE
jgi:hypothetical protein